MSRAINLLGQRFGNLIVRARAENGLCCGKKTARWECKCDCGNVEIKGAANLKNGVGNRCRECWKAEMRERMKDNKRAINCHKKKLLRMPRMST